MHAQRCAAMTYSCGCSSSSRLWTACCAALCVQQQLEQQQPGQYLFEEAAYYNPAGPRPRPSILSSRQHRLHRPHRQRHKQHAVDCVCAIAAWVTGCPGRTGCTWLQAPAITVTCKEGRAEYSRSCSYSNRDGPGISGCVTKYNRRSGYNSRPYSCCSRYSNEPDPSNNRTGHSCR